ncbi:MAG: hypothetical protein LIP77_01785, partial [Planctomycetes bacterium]|nr:hypothetical protein [Planctomycetota bacterium]
MDIDPLAGLEIAHECLVAAGPEGGVAETMDAMHRVLHDRAIDYPLPAAGGRAFLSHPAVLRRSMVSEGYQRVGLVRLSWNLVGGLLGCLALWILPWRGRQA